LRAGPDSPRARSSADAQPRAYANELDELYFVVGN
jgi:hypothetical protein